MLEQVLGWVGLGFIAIWVLAMLYTNIVYIIASFRANVGLAIASMIIPFVGLYMLVRYWDDLKKPFLNQLSVSFGGFAIFMIGGIALSALTKGQMTDEPGFASNVEPPTMGKNQLIEPTPPSAVTPPPEMTGPATDTSLPEMTGSPAGIEPTPPSAPGIPVVALPTPQPTLITVPKGWEAMSWNLPHQAVASGHIQRGEFTTVHAFDKVPDQSFEDFQEFALQKTTEQIIDSSNPGAAQGHALNGFPAASRGLSGLGRLPDQAGQPMSARLCCLDGPLQRYYIVQWRTSAWDAQTIRSFDLMLRSFSEGDAE